jgi:Ca2+-binding EF-hand superfamily protein
MTAEVVSNFYHEMVKLVSRFYEPITSIPEESMEKYKSSTGLNPKEIVRLHEVFKKVAEGKDILSLDNFLNMEGIVHNPLKDRISICFGYDDENAGLDFEAFLTGVALFNAPGKREMKIKTAFKIQDFDNDGVINKQDLITYIKRITGPTTLEEKDLEQVVDSILQESSSDANKEHLTFNDFRKVVVALDFQAKLILPI